MREVGLRRIRGAWILLMVGGLAFSSWPLAFAVDTGLQQSSTYASEYEAVGHPWAWLFRLVDVASGLALGVGALLALPAARAPRPRWPMGTVYAATAAIGWTLVGTAVFPVDCSDSDGQCAGRAGAGLSPSWHDRAHHLISDVSGSAFSLALLALVAAVLLHTAGPLARRSAVVLLLAALSTSSLVEDRIWSAQRHGIPQRFDEAVETLFFLVLAVDLARRRPAGPGRDAPDARAHPAQAERR